MGKKGIELKRIFLLVEGSDAGMRAAAYAVDLAQTLGASVHAVSVVETDTMSHLLSRSILVQSEMAELAKEMSQNARKHLDYVEGLCQQKWVPIETDQLEGSIHRSVLETLSESSYDLLIVGSYQATMTQRDLAAHEKQLIIESAPCPVLLVK